MDPKLMDALKALMAQSDGALKERFQKKAAPPAVALDVEGGEEGGGEPSSGDDMSPEDKAKLMELVQKYC